MVGITLALGPGEVGSLRMGPGPPRSNSSGTFDEFILGIRFFGSGSKKEGAGLSLLGLNQSGFQTHL